MGAMHRASRLVCLPRARFQYNYANRKSARCIAHNEAMSLTNALLSTMWNRTGTATDWDRPGGLRMGTIEVTRLGMGEVEEA